MTSDKTTTGSSILGDGLYADLLAVTRTHSVHLQDEGTVEERSQRQVTIDVLPDNVLLEVFDFYKDGNTDGIQDTRYTWWWKMLTQVCRRWRHIIFASPRRLDLRIVCTNATPVRTSLEIWPPFPINVVCSPLNTEDDKSAENIIAALEHRDRISSIIIKDANHSTLDMLAAVTQEPFPALKHLTLCMRDRSAPMLPEEFLGGSAPHLHACLLSGVQFPAVPRFILSATTNIVILDLTDIPNSGYISPEVMVTYLAALPNLEYVSIGFQSPLSRPSQRSRTLPTRTVFPALNTLFLLGVSEYFEEFVAQIDTPRLKQLSVEFFMDLIFDIPRLHNFISRTQSLWPFSQARMESFGSLIRMELGSTSQFHLGVKCERLDWQLSSMTQIFGQQLPLLPHIERLEICRSPRMGIEWEDDPDMDSSQWLEFLDLFISAQTLHVSEKLVLRVVAALQGLSGERAMEVLPALRRLTVEDSPGSASAAPPSVIPMSPRNNQSSSSSPPGPSAFYSPFTGTPFIPPPMTPPGSYLMPTGASVAPPSVIPMSPRNNQSSSSSPPGPSAFYSPFPGTPFIPPSSPMTPPGSYFMPTVQLPDNAHPGLEPRQVVYVKEALKSFLASRRVSDQPIDIQRWE